jgi:hypothetical protein
MSVLHDAWIADKDNYVDKLPVVEMKGTKLVPTQNGVIAQPVFKIVDWIARPDDLPNTTISVQRSDRDDGEDGGGDGTPPDWEDVPFE